MKLKTHTKILLAMAILSVTCAGIWLLGLKDVVAKLTSGGSKQVAVTADGAPSTVPTGEPVGTDANPLKVSIVSWHGYAPALVANGNALKTQPGSLYANEGVNVEFLLQDDLPTLVSSFESGVAQCSWRTIDFFAQEHPQVRNNKLDARIVAIVDNSRGSDAVIAKGDVNSIEDLAGKSVALAQFTPSDMVLQNAVQQSSLTARKRDAIAYKYIASLAEVRAAFEAGQVDAAVLWEPDTSLALKRTPGSHVVYSTKTATNLIYDVMVCDKRVIDANPDAIQKFVNGWMKGIETAEKNRAEATKALRATEPLFDTLIKEEGDAFMDGLYEGVVWTGLDENIRIMGMAGGSNYAEAVYSQADKIWRGNTELIAKDTPVIAPSEAFDYRFIKKLADADAAAKEAAKKPEFTFTETQRDEAVKKSEAQLTKPVSINFAPGTSELSKRAIQTIDTEMVPLLDSMGGAYFSVEGNTDGTGNAAANKRLSKERAEAVVSYLVKQWEYPAERFRIVGNGAEKMRCDEGTPSSEGLSAEDCRALNRRTDVAVYSR
jgi:NitT/TauT family transport system substrate-binding protein